MKEETTTAPLGQEPGASLIHLLDKQTRAIVRMTAAFTTLHRRLDALEGRVRPEEAAADVAEEEVTFDDSAPLAMLCDKRILLNTRELGDVDLGDRPRWEGVILSEAEASDILDHLDAAFAAAAALVGGGILRRIKKVKTEEADAGDR